MAVNMWFDGHGDTTGARDWIHNWTEYYINVIIMDQEADYIN